MLINTNFLRVSLKTELLQYLVCPTCKGQISINIHKKIKNEIINGTINCKNCKNTFPVTEGIPRFVVDKSKDFIKTEDAFSAKWRIHHKNHQAKDWIEFQKKWFLDRFGWKSLTEFNDFLKDKQYVLEAGTGVGNTAKMLSVNSTSQVFAIDASQSIDFAYKKYGKTPNLHFLQADLRELPFKTNFFNYILSDQVLHHTKNTFTSFKYLTKFLAKKGHISIYVYNKKAPIREYADDHIRKTTVNMSVRDCTEFSKDMALLGKSLSKLNKKIIIPNDIPILGIKAGTYDIQRFIYWHFLKCFWDPSDNLERSVGVNFDWYSPKYAYRHTPAEVKKCYKESKLKITHFKEIESGISVTGKK
ncbi:SAM dependent methyltransferase [metagenome]